MKEMKTFTMNGETYDVIDDGAVRFDNTQTLTDKQKEQVKVNIGLTGVGLDGKDGYTPVKGVDYWTEADKIELVKAINEGIPDYVKNSAKALSHKISARQNGDTFCFAFLSDAHIGEGNTQADLKSYVSAHHAGQALSLINKYCKLDFVAHGGDYTKGSRREGKEITLREFDDYRNIIGSATPGTPNLFAVGNHDDLPYRKTEERFTQSEVFGAIGRMNYQQGYVCPAGCNYGYLDLDSQKVRVIVVDSHDRRSFGSTDETQTTGNAFLNLNNVGAGQLNFIATKALDLSSKSDQSEWTIVAFSHIVLGNDGSTYTDPDNGVVHNLNTTNVPALFDAYNKKGTGSITHENETITYDFSQASARVACVVCGDQHNYHDRILAGSILSIGCPNVLDGREALYADGTPKPGSYPKTPGTAEGTSFCVITVDAGTSKIYADHYGAGYDRAWMNIDGIWQENMLKEYVSNKALSTTTGEVVDGSVYVTGLIECNSGDTFYLHNLPVELNSTPGTGSKGDYRFAAYDENGAFIFASNFSNIRSAITEEYTANPDGKGNSFLYSFTLKGSKFDNVKFFRISSTCIDDSSLITKKTD